MATINFQGQIDAFAKKAGLASQTVTRRVVAQVLGGVVEMTPVDTGHARSNWQVNLGTATAIELPGVDDPIAREAVNIEKIQGGEKVYIFNNAPYIGALEFGQYPDPPKHGTGKTVGGYSTQAPAGMARVTAQRVAAQMNTITGGEV